MADDQYAQLTARMGFKKEGMSDVDFATGLEGSSAPRVNPTRASLPTPGAPPAPPSTERATGCGVGRAQAQALTQCLFSGWNRSFCLI